MEFIPAKTIISSFTPNGWFGSSYNMNIYKGCSHGCIYCDSRSECYQIRDFDTEKPKQNALAVIDTDLHKKRKSGLIITGAMSDPYNPLERELLLTRGTLELIARHGFGIALLTKSDLVLRDIDVLKQVQKNAPAVVNITITCADDDLCAKIERDVCLSGERFAALERLSQAGIPCGVLLMPILPFINDTEENITAIVRKTAQSGAKWISVYPGFGVTLRQNQRDFFFERLDEDFPGKRELYAKTFGNSYECTSPNQEQLYSVFKRECKQAGLLYKSEEIAELIKKDYEAEQMCIN
jgi:DNA repair photolyase